VTKHPEPEQQPDPADAGTPVPNRRERRGGKAGATSLRGGKSAVGRMHAAAPNPKQYSTRRRGG
jgi:hypothetical protein